MELCLVTYTEYGDDWENNVTDSIWSTEELAKERIDFIKQQTSKFSRIGSVDYEIFNLDNEEE